MDLVLELHFILKPDYTIHIYIFSTSAVGYGRIVELDPANKDSGTRSVPGEIARLKNWVVAYELGFPPSDNIPRKIGQHQVDCTNSHNAPQSRHIQVRRALRAYC